MSETYVFFKPPLMLVYVYPLDVFGEEKGRQ